MLVSSNLDPYLQSILSIILNASFSFSTCLLPIVAYLIIRKSKQMRKYRYYMLNNVIWCYIYHLGIFIARPIVLFPSFCLIINPIIDLPENFIVAALYFLTIVVINMDLSVVLSLFYRYSQAFPGWLNIYFEQSKSIYLIYAVVHLTIYATLVLPLYFGRITDPVEVKKQFLAENPTLQEHLNKTIICFSNTDKTIYIGLYISLLLIAFFALGTTLYTFLFVRMRIARRNSTIASTYRLQLMLFRAISVQLYIGYTFLLIPTVIIGFMVFFQVKNTGNAMAVVFVLMGMHDFLDYLTMLYFITPYKRTVLQWMRLREKTTEMPTVRVTFFTTSTVLRP